MTQMSFGDEDQLELPVGSMDHDEWLGSRGGSTVTYGQGAKLLEEHKGDDLNAVRRKILHLFGEQKEVHADDVADVPVSQRNVVGVAFRSLVEDRIIWSTGEHRASKLPAAHGRRSYVYRLTEKGERVINHQV